MRTLRIFSRIMMASVTLAAMLPAQTKAGAAGQPGAGAPDQQNVAHGWTLKDLDAPLAEQLGFPRWFSIGGQYRGRFMDETAVKFVPSTGFDFLANKKLKLRADFLEDYLATTEDGLYTSGGVLKVLNRTATSRHVGSEADFQGIFRLSSGMAVHAGFSHLFPGEFLKQSTKGSGYSCPFVMWTKNF